MKRIAVSQGIDYVFFLKKKKTWNVNSMGDQTPQ
jgi:hypothetical protein